MIEHYFLKQQTLDRIRASWLGEPIERYVTWLHKQRYAARSIYRRVPLLMRFAEYARAHGATTWGDLPCSLRPFIEHWLRKRDVSFQNEVAKKKVINCTRGPIEQMLSLIVPGFSGTGRTRHARPFLDEAPDFFAHLQEERGLRPGTLDHYDFYLHSLQVYLREIGVTSVKELSAPILSGFVTARSQQWNKSCVSGACSALRVFLKYLHRERIMTRDISHCIDAPKKYRMAEIPRSISWSAVERMLDVVDRRTTVGRRDYAILLLLVTYGLRSREIAALTLDDLDWERERLRVPERKAGHSTAYPLSPIVGEAIVHYLKHGRPESLDRHLFFRFLAPFRPFSASAISSRAAHYLKKAGIEVVRPGSHTLRHTCVQRLVDAHFSLKAIGDYVGHRCADSTAIYSKIDMEALREIALSHEEEGL